jgi:hypothetical protein
MGADTDAAATLAGDFLWVIPFNPRLKEHGKPNRPEWRVTIE